MAYEQAKDVMIKSFTHLQMDGKELIFSIFSYDKGPKKLSFTRMYPKIDGTHGYAQIGRMTLEEIKFLKEKIDDIITIIEGS